MTDKRPLHVQLGLPRPRGLARMPKPGAKPRKRPVQHEEQFTIQVAEYFGWALPKTAVFFHVPNGGWRSKGIAGRLKAMGTKQGVADFVILYAGVYHELELKVLGGSQSFEQREHERAVISAGGKYGVARDTLDDVCRRLELWGIPHARITGRPVIQR